MLVGPPFLKGRGKLSAGLPGGARHIFISGRDGLRGVASWVWERITWSKALFGLLLLNVFWCLSFFLAPFTIAPGTFAFAVGTANQMNHWNLWKTLWIYPQAVYAFGDIQCHQLWYRSLWLNGNQLPMCARMTSMYIFANFGLAAAAFAQPSTSASRVMVDAMPAWIRRRLARFSVERGSALIVIGGLLPIAIDGFYQLASAVTHYESTNITRILTGVPGGFVGGLLVGAMLVSIRQFQADIARMRAQTPPSGA